MKPTSEVTALIWDHGIFADIATVLAQKFRRTILYIPNFDAWKKKNEAVIGQGIPGVEVTHDPFSVLDEVDLCIFPDTGFGDLQEHMLKLGKAVWGSRRGENIELDRVLLKRVLENRGLPVGPYEVIRGTKALRGFLRENEDQWIKISEWRASAESFHSPTLKEIEPKLDKLEFDLGPLKTDFEFVVESGIHDTVEIGTDQIIVDGQLASRVMSGLEIKDSLYIARMLDSAGLPEPLKRVDEVLSQVFGEYGYRGQYSTETMVGEDGLPYVLDMTARMGNPPAPLQSRFYRNFADIIWHGANGILLNPETEAEFGAQVLLKSEWADKEGWQPLDFPDSIRPFIHICNPCYRDGQFYSVPLRHGLKEVASVVGWGDSPEAAYESAVEHAKEVSGCDLKFDESAWESAQKTMKQAEKFGVSVF